MRSRKILELLHSLERPANPVITFTKPCGGRPLRDPLAMHDA
jgi:hypothetical protein